MRTRQQTHFAYNGLSPAEFGERTGQSPAQVRALIAAGWFDWTEDGKPGCLDIARLGAKQPTYKIHPVAVDRFYRERAGWRKYPKIERRVKTS